MGGFSACFSSRDVCRICHCQYSDLESRIHDFEKDGEHQYWSVAEYDNITDNLVVDSDHEEMIEEVNEGNLFGDLANENSENEEDSDEDENIERINLRGVKAVCPLNTLTSFHSVTSFPPDILHDVMEGVIPEDLLGIIRILSRKGWFTIASYNDALERMDFTSYERGDKPYPIPTSNSVKKLKGKAVSNLGRGAFK